jgi:hypothetical protein
MKNVTAYLYSHKSAKLESTKFYEQVNAAMVFCTTRSVNYIAQHMEISFQPIGASPQLVQTGTGWETTSMVQGP